ncbi:Uncharacterised protein [Mycobacteroides abscessus subsp. abscessus]|nr:Uncharacterised protein [Mycobacteroides abscessus subsp. abscessus]
MTRQGVDRTHRLVVHYVRHGHPRQPLAHITFFQPGSIGKLFTRRAGRGRQRVQQAGLMTDAHQQDQGGIVDGRGEALRKFLSGLWYGVCTGSSHAYPPYASGREDGEISSTGTGLPHITPLGLLIPLVVMLTHRRFGEGDRRMRQREEIALTLRRAVLTSVEVAVPQA